MKPNPYPFLILLGVVLVGAALLYFTSRPVGRDAAAPDARTPVSDPPAASPPAVGKGNTTVVWISIDGFRPDYRDRTETPFFDRFTEEGMWTDELIPVFPSLTFPSHVSQATGVTAGTHGIPGNSLHDAATGETLRYPNAAALLEAEPIWITAKRQGVRTAVFDWPLSHAQEGEISADYFGEKFDGSLSDKERLDRLLDIIRTQPDDAAPLRLIMGYIVGTDGPGHRHGPNAPEMAEVIARVDADLGAFFDELVSIFREKMRDGDVLYLVVTTDHGMAEVDQLVNLPVLLGGRLPHEVEIVTGGNVANIHLQKLPAARRNVLAEEILSALEQHDFVTAWRREDLPEEWGYSHPTRVGEIVAVLEPGYTFSRQLQKAVYSVEEGGGPYGMHGYDPREDDAMLGWMGVWRYPAPLGGGHMGSVHALQLHATVAGLLGITPSPEAESGAVKPERRFENRRENAPWEKGK